MNEEHVCEQSEALKDVEIRLHSGELRFIGLENSQSQILAEIKLTSTNMKKVHDKMFIDNGSPSFQTRLDRHDTLMKFVVKAVVVISTGLTGIAITLIVQAITHAAGGN